MISQVFVARKLLLQFVGIAVMIQTESQQGQILYVASWFGPYIDGL
jgi:hypothetical protein